MLQMPAKPENIGPLDLTQAMVNMQNFATMFTLPEKTEAELAAMFPDTSYKSDKYLALAKARPAFAKAKYKSRSCFNAANYWW